ncbi:MAG TPA: aldo/keto reductase [Candidatus Acidoferrales bacterium]|nr:aldo/keto reductase [Candidatus Acidoferrales bacterium]
MIKRRLGNSGLEIGPLVFGGNIFGWTADEPTSFKLLDAFVASGLNMIDTADVYSKWIPGHVGGESETIIGNWLDTPDGHRGVPLPGSPSTQLAPGLWRSHESTNRKRSLERCPLAQ